MCLRRYSKAPIRFRILIPEAIPQTHQGWAANGEADGPAKGVRALAVSLFSENRLKLAGIASFSASQPI